MNRCPMQKEFKTGSCRRLPGADGYLSKADEHILLADLELEERRKLDGLSEHSRSANDVTIGNLELYHRGVKKMTEASLSRFRQQENENLKFHRQSYIRMKREALLRQKEMELAQYTQELKNIGKALWRSI